MKICLINRLCRVSNSSNKGKTDVNLLICYSGLQCEQTVSFKMSSLHKLLIFKCNFKQISQNTLFTQSILSTQFSHSLYFSTNICKINTACSFNFNFNLPIILYRKMENIFTESKYFVESFL